MAKENKTPEIQEKIVPVFIEEEMRNSYIDYSMSVIVARALPDVRDGLKPVHRRVLYGMLDLGLRPTSAYKKSARIVGEVLGKYHPHGDSAVYDAMVRMVQDFSLRYPLVDGQGNFGSIDGDAPAAMRYTEARLAAIAEEVIRDIDKETVEFVPNFDDSLKEPSVMPSLLPTLLVNGAAGIAVGMATNIPPHNLGEVIDALVATIDKPDMKPEDVRKYLRGPDFPTGAIITGEEEIISYFKTGRGKLTVRAKVHIEDVTGGRQRIVVTEIPYQVNKTSLIERVAELVRDKKIEGIYDIRDESDREGMRIVFELRKEVDSEAILRELFRHSQMEGTFGVIMLALVNGQPKIMNIKQFLTEFLAFRHDVVLRRTKFELAKAEARAHILEGLKIALDHIDAIVALIKKSKDVDTAKKGLMKSFRLSDIQAQAILDMRLQRLTGLERKKIEDEYLELIKQIQKLKSLLNSKTLRMRLVREELLGLKEKYGDARKTQILSTKGVKDKGLAQLVSDEEYVVVLTRQGQTARFPMAEYQQEAANRLLLAKDYIRYSFVASTGQQILLFSQKGRAFLVRTSLIPLAIGEGGGGAISRLLQLQQDEMIVNCLPVQKTTEEKFIFLATQNGLVKRIPLADFSRVKEGGSTIIGLKEDDRLVSTQISEGAQQILLLTSGGKAIRFEEEQVRAMGLAAGGIKGLELEKTDKVISLVVIASPRQELLSITRLGYGKKTDLKEYPCVRRGGKGIVNYKISPKVGPLAAAVEVRTQDVLLLVTKKGKLKRLKAKEIKKMGRVTQGGAVANIVAGDEVSDMVFQTEPGGGN
jgi:DNA gyrase subunit A